MLRTHVFTALLLCSLFALHPQQAFALLKGANDLERGLENNRGSTQAVEELISELHNVQQQFLDPYSFLDVASDDWHYPYIRSIAEWGIVSGYRDALGNRTGYFGPGDPVTIAQMLRMTMEAANVNVGACDTPGSSWQYKYLVCGQLLELRILKGNVNVDRPALRGEVLGLIHDVFDEHLQLEASPFVDTDKHMYEHDIAHATAQGVVSGDIGDHGKPTGRFRPNSLINRAEASKILHQKLWLLVGNAEE